jgi:hypothetical protein
MTGTTLLILAVVTAGLTILTVKGGRRAEHVSLQASTRRKP